VKDGVKGTGCPALTCPPVSGSGPCTSGTVFAPGCTTSSEYAYGTCRASMNSSVTGPCGATGMLNVPSGFTGWFTEEFVGDDTSPATICRKCTKVIGPGFTTRPLTEPVAASGTLAFPQPHNRAQLTTAAAAPDRRKPIML